jgi:YVTN family beta-propeller protein
VTINAYITNSAGGTVSVIDTKASPPAVTTTITVGTSPHGAVVSPDGKTALVANGGSTTASSTVSVIDTASNTVTATITISASANNDYGVAISPNGTTALVTNGVSPGGKVYVIDLTANPPALKTGTGYPITVGDGPLGVAFTTDGRTALVANATGGTVSVIDMTANPPAAKTGTGYPITVGSAASGVALSPDGKTALVTNEGAGTVSVIDMTANPPAAKTGTGYPITVGTHPLGVAFTPDGKTALVANGNSPGTVSVIDMTANPPAAKTGTGYPVSVGNFPQGIAITPDGKAGYVANQIAGGTVSVIDLTASPPSVSNTISAGNQPYAFGIFIQPASIPMSNIAAPQGRLTLNSTLSVMTADATAQSTIYYLPYQGAGVPVYDGAQFNNQLLGSTGISLALDSNSAHTGYQGPTGSLFDVFAFLNGGVLTLGTGPAWSSSTAGSSSRGYTLSQVNGIWVNNAAITLRFGTASGDTVSVLANEATYLGTMYATAAGQTGIALSPAAASLGTNNVIGLWNAYNKIPVTAKCTDSTVSWTYNSTNIRNANGSAGNRISWVDGLAQSSIYATYGCVIAPPASTAGQIGIGLNGTGFSGRLAQSPDSTSTIGSSELAEITSYPLLGLSYVQACENINTGTSACTFYSSSGGYGNLLLSISI